MANTLTITDLSDDLYASRNLVARELTGFIPSILTNGDIAQAAEGQTIKSMRSSQVTVGTSIAPGKTAPDSADYAPGNETMTLDKAVTSAIRVTGANEALLNSGPGYEEFRQQTFAEMIRALVNKLESDVAATAYKYASRAVGTAGTTPFADDFKILAQLRKILADNGCQMADGMLSCVMDTAAGAALRSLATLNAANENASDATRRRGELLNIHGFAMKESAQVRNHTKGAGASYLVDLVAGYAIGATSLTLDTGTGAILAGDVITIADDPSAAKYVVHTGIAQADESVVLNRPGLRGAVVNNKAVTVGDSYTANLAFHRSAIELAMRPPSVPTGGDGADDTLDVFDPVTGLSFQARTYREYRQVYIELSAVYGIKVWKPEFVATLLG